MNIPQTEMIIKTGWGKSQSEVKCGKCGNIVEENYDYYSMSTGHHYRCLKCKTDMTVDESTQWGNPKKWKQFINNFNTKIRK